RSGSRCVRSARPQAPTDLPATKKPGWSMDPFELGRIPTATMTIGTEHGVDELGRLPVGRLDVRLHAKPPRHPRVVGPPLARRLGQRGWQGVGLPEAERGFERAPEVGTIDRKAGGDDDKIREIFRAAARAAAGAVLPR